MTPLIVVHKFLAQCPSDSLYHTALHLPFYIAGINGFARVLHNGRPQDIHFARVWIYFDIYD